ncbi:MAG: NAD(+)/NADH kinase [Chthonomonas sp.]|nr:NAD(+)/NADH kinase [Chthonomonas sp.]
MRIHILVHMHRPDAITAAERVGAMLQAKGVEVFAEPDVASHIGLPEIAMNEVPNADLVVTFGGDGTLIRAAQLCSEAGTPILGVYYGRFGFVTQCHPNEIGAALSQFIDGKSRIESRMMVEAEIFRDGKPVAALRALNEAVVQRAATTRILDFEVVVDGKFITQYAADGIIISSPTGSTAYNLSAGGPIVDPSLDALILSPITPHTLNTRSLVFGPDSVIDVQIETRGDAVLSCDGAHRLAVLSGDYVRITRSSVRTNLVCVDEFDFLTKLSDRLLGARHTGADG